MHHLRILLLAALPLAAQHSTSIPSPYAIREAIAGNPVDYDLDALYRTLHLPNTFQVSGEKPIPNPHCRERNCSAEVQPITTLAMPGQPTHLLTLCWSVGTLCRIVFFREEIRPRRWSVLGHIDAEDHYGVSFTPANPFQLQVLIARGTGVSHRLSKWYFVDEKGPRLVLTVQDHGADVNVHPHRRFKAMLLSAETAHGEDILTFLYYVAFHDPDLNLGAIPLFDERRLVRFVRPIGEGVYKFDAAHSEITQAEIDTFFAVDTNPAPTQLLTFARASLLRIAHSGNAAQKHWLANYLTAAPASAVKSEILRSLKSEPSK